MITYWDGSGSELWALYSPKGTPFASSLGTRTRWKPRPGALAHGSCLGWATNWLWMRQDLFLSLHLCICKRRLLTMESHSMDCCQNYWTDTKCLHSAWCPSAMPPGCRLTARPPLGGEKSAVHSDGWRCRQGLRCALDLYKRGHVWDSWTPGSQNKAWSLICDLFCSGASNGQDHFSGWRRESSKDSSVWLAAEWTGEWDQCGACKVPLVASGPHSGNHRLLGFAWAESQRWDIQAEWRTHWMESSWSVWNNFILWKVTFQ